MASVSFFVRVSIILGLYALDPLQMSSVTDDASAEIVNRIGSLIYEGDGQDAVTVILIDDSYLIDTKSQWPLPYAEQSKLFRQIFRYKPDAMFIDLLYTHDRAERGDSFSTLKNVLDRAGRRTPVFIPKPDTSEFSDEALFSTAHPVDVQWQGHDDFYPRALGVLPTPASALFEVYCQRHDCEHGALAGREDMYIQWGSKLHPEQENFTPLARCMRYESTIASFFHIFISEVFWKLADDWRQPCPYTRTIMAQQLSANSDEAESLLSEAITGKIVLVGALIQGARDEIVTPVNGKIAGVYFHAMALDNLITMQDSYYRPAPSVFRKLDAVDVADCVLLVLVMLWSRYSEGKLHWFTRNKTVLTPQQIKLRSLCGALAVISIILATSYVFVSVFHTQPINWILIILLVVGVLVDQYRRHHLDINLIKKLKRKGKLMLVGLMRLFKTEER